MPQDLLELALAEIVRRVPGADLRPGSHLRTLVEAAVQQGLPLNIDLSGGPRRLVNGGQYNPPRIPLQITSFDELMGRPRRTPAEERRAGQRSVFDIIYGYGQRRTTLDDVRMPGSSHIFGHGQDLELPVRGPERPRSLTLRDTFERLYRGVFRQEQGLVEYPAEGQTFTRQPLPPLRSPERQRLADSIAAEEDRAIFAALDAATAERAESLLPNNGIHTAPPFTSQDMQDLFANQLLPAPATRPWTVEELPGRMAINPAALRRFQMPSFEIASNPSIRLDDVRTRRFDILEPAAITQTPEQDELWRQAFLGTNPFAEPGLFPAQLGMLSAQEFGATRNPCGEIPLAPREMTRAEMEEIALIVRRPSWERLLKDPDY